MRYFSRIQACAENLLESKWETCSIKWWTAWKMKGNHQIWYRCTSGSARKFENQITFIWLEMSVCIPSMTYKNKITGLHFSTTRSQYIGIAVVVMIHYWMPDILLHRSISCSFFSLSTVSYLSGAYGPKTEQKYLHILGKLSYIYYAFHRKQALATLACDTWLSAETYENDYVNFSGHLPLFNPWPGCSILLRTMIYKRKQLEKHRIYISHKYYYIATGDCNNGFFNKLAI